MKWICHTENDVGLEGPYSVRRWKVGDSVHAYPKLPNKHFEPGDPEAVQWMKENPGNVAEILSTKRKPVTVDEVKDELENLDSFDEYIAPEDDNTDIDWGKITSAEINERWKLGYKRPDMVKKEKLIKLALDVENGNRQRANMQSSDR